MSKKPNNNGLMRGAGGRFVKADSGDPSSVEVLPSTFKNPLGRPVGKRNNDRTDKSIVDDKRRSAREVRKLLTDIAPAVWNKVVDKALLGDDERFLLLLAQHTAPKDIYNTNTSDYDLRRPQRVAQYLHEKMLENPRDAKYISEISSSLGILSRLNQQPDLNQIMTSNQKLEKVTIRSMNKDDDYTKLLHKELGRVLSINPLLFDDVKDVLFEAAICRQNAREEEIKADIYLEADHRYRSVISALTEWEHQTCRGDIGEYDIIWLFSHETKDGEEKINAMIERDNEQEINEHIKNNIKRAKRAEHRLEAERAEALKELSEAQSATDTKVDDLNATIAFMQGDRKQEEEQGAPTKTKKKAKKKQRKKIDK